MNAPLGDVSFVIIHNAVDLPSHLLCWYSIIKIKYFCFKHVICYQIRIHTSRCIARGGGGLYLS